MASNKASTVKKRRNRESKTDYKKRLLLLKGKNQRLVIRKFNKNLLAQVVEYSPEGDKVVATAYSKELEKYGWKHAKSNTPAAYLTGLLLSKKVKAKNMTADIGLQSSTKGGKIFACIKGCADGGINLSFKEDIMPDEERIKGKHISEKIEKSFEDTKKKISEVKK